MVLGGWNSNFTIAYNIPSKGFLYSDGNYFKLNNLT